MTAPRRIADDIIVIGVASAEIARQTADHLRSLGCFRDVVPGMREIAVTFDPVQLTTDRIVELIYHAQTAGAAGGQQETEVRTIPVRYGGEVGPDLERVAAQLELHRDDLIARHTGQTFTIEMMGFTPGFAYVGGGDWSVPRLPLPRAFVTAGSVGMAGSMTGIYSLDGPGGWPLIGRTDLALFDRERENPFLLRAGQKIRFEAVSLC